MAKRKFVGSVDQKYRQKKKMKRYDDSRRREARHRSGNYGGTPEYWDTQNQRGESASARHARRTLKGSSKRKESGRILSNYDKGASKGAKKPNEHKARKPATGQVMYPSHVASRTNSANWRATMKVIENAARQALNERNRS